MRPGSGAGFLFWQATRSERALEDEADAWQLLHDTLRKPLHETPQDGTLATYCRKLSRDDAKADPATMTAEDIDRRVHALVPWPGVIIEIDGEPLKILSAELSPTKDSTPLACKDSTLHLVSVQPAGKKPMSGKAWANGRQSL